MTRPETKPARSLGDLVRAGLLPADRVAALDAVVDTLPVGVSADLLAATVPGDAADPIARQFLPDLRELTIAPEELADPIGDEVHAPVKGIVHRYPDRVLLKPLLTCPVYCRFCFRREAVGPGSDALTATELAQALDYIRARPEIWEVILTGGDPLMLSPRRLGQIVGALDAIPHVGVIRLHSRVPVADPKRVTPALIASLQSRSAAVYLAVHCNHARELSPAALGACASLSAAGIPLLGQSVLLRGVNDSVEALSALMRALVRARIKPYYLHHGDLARGTGHFRTSIAEGQALMRALRGRLSGLAQPTYVLDLPGGHGKVPVGPSYVTETEGGSYLIEDPWGERHLYPPAAPVAGPDR